MTQNKSRDAVVPIPAINKMITKLEMPSYDEFADIYYFAVDE